MKMPFEELLQLVHKEADRKDPQRLGQRYYDMRQTITDVAGVSSAASPQQGLMDQIMHHIHLAYRAIRRPLPTPAEVEQMIMTYVIS